MRYFLLLKGGLLLEAAASTGIFAAPVVDLEVRLDIILAIILQTLNRFFSVVVHLLRVATTRTSHLHSFLYTDSVTQIVLT